MAWIDDIADGDACTALATRIAGGGQLSGRGLVGSSAVVLAAALARRCERPMLLVVAHIDEADEAADEFESFGIRAVKFPAMEVLPGETGVSPELLAERLTLLRLLADGAPPQVIVAPIHVPL